MLAEARRQRKLQRETAPSPRWPPPRARIRDAVSEPDLLARLRQGDSGAFDQLFREHYAALVAHAARLLHERATAEDLVQEVMLELWRRRAALTRDESLRAYLYRATRNRALNHLRHQRVERRLAPYAAAPAAQEPAAPAQLAEAEIDAAVRAAVASLPARCREVFELSRGEGLRYAEIAQVLGISVKTVEAQMGKALRVLRDRLAPWLPAGSGTGARGA